VASIYYYGPASQVLVNGDLQGGWSAPDTLYSVACGENTFFSISYLLPSDARVDYQLVVDGAYITDPRNPVITPSGYGPHSQLAMPRFHPDPVRVRMSGVPCGSLDSVHFSSKRAGFTSREVRVYLPAGYDTLRSLPVIYVMDGLEALAWMDYAIVLDNLIARARIRPVIAVFIPPGDRGGEFMGKGKKRFLDVLCREFIPWIERTYRTDPRAASRAISGISAGGYFALYTVLSRPNVISCGAGQSPAIDGEIYAAARSLARKRSQPPGLRIYFDMGLYDIPVGLLGGKSFVQSGLDLSQEMEDLGLNHRFQVSNDGHEWANWRERTDEILQYFFPATEQ
jgi:enterochelin esterase family protein